MATSSLSFADYVAELASYIVTSVALNVDWSACRCYHCFESPSANSVAAAVVGVAAFDATAAADRNTAVADRNIVSSSCFVVVVAAVVDVGALVFADQIHLQNLKKKKFSREFSVKSARNHIDDILLPSVGSITRWIHAVQIKINVFAWKVCLDILPTRFNLSLRGLDIPSILCPVCHLAGESSSHLFFSCNVARQLLQKIARWWELDVLDLFSYDDWISWFSSLRLAKGIKSVLEGVFYVTWWAIWKYRNQVLFGSSQSRLDLILDEIVLMSYTWCSSRCKCSFDWSIWLKCPSSLSL
ncbi:RNA-directed DNA polymerase, eukaryota [Tanacetum coccineum]